MQRGKQQKNLFDQPPEWVSEAIVYEVFPDRFRRSGLVKAQHKMNLRPWSSKPVQHGFHGGDLYGLIDGLDYLEELGVNCIYLTPVFSSAANHRYHTYDYFQVDPLLGGNSALEALIEALHRREMRILLDGVFNHCGRGFWAFNHLIENGKDSPYRDWFHIHKWPLNPYPKPGEDCGYSCWWNAPALPKFNHDYGPVRDYLLNVASYWIKRGIDGWRLDVPDEVPFDFWVEFRQKVKSLNSQAWIVGEIWGDARPWLREKLFDGVMNYRIGWSSLCWSAGKRFRSNYRNPDYPIASLDSLDLIRIWETTFGWYSPEVNRSQLNLLDSHDVPRALNTLKGDVAALKLSLTLIFFQPGAPCIYYGTELGLDGGEEPSCREAMPWERRNHSLDLRGFIKELTLLRRSLLVFCKQGLKWNSIEDDGLYGCAGDRSLSNDQDQKCLLIWCNRSRKSWLKVPESLSCPFWTLGQIDQEGGRLGPQSVVVLKWGSSSSLFGFFEFKSNALAGT